MMRATRCWCRWRACCNGTCGAATALPATVARSSWCCWPMAIWPAGASWPKFAARGTTATGHRTGRWQRTARYRQLRCGRGRDRCTGLAHAAARCGRGHVPGQGTGARPRARGRRWPQPALSSASADACMHAPKRPRDHAARNGPWHRQPAPAQRAHPEGGAGGGQHLPVGSVSQPRVKAMLPLLCSTSPQPMIRPGRAGLTKLVLDSTVTAMRLAGSVA